MPDDDDLIAQTDRPTDRIDPQDVRVSWPLAIATLEQLGGWTVLALRLGTLALIQRCIRDMAMENANAGLVVEMRVFVEALARMPWEQA